MTSGEAESEKDSVPEWAKQCLNLLTFVPLKLEAQLALQQERKRERDGLQSQRQEWSSKMVFASWREF